MVYVSANPFMVRSAITAFESAMLTSLGLGGRITSFEKDEKRMRRWVYRSLCAAIESER